MFRTYQAVLQPTAGQRLRLVRLLGVQRELYNAALEERIGVWRLEHRSVSRFEQFRALTGWEHPILECGHVAHADVNAARNILRAGLALRSERKADQHAA